MKNKHRLYDRLFKAFVISVLPLYAGGIIAIEHWHMTLATVLFGLSIASTVLSGLMLFLLTRES